MCRLLCSLSDINSRDQEALRVFVLLGSSDKLAVGIRAASPAWLSGAFPRSMGSHTPRIPCRAWLSFSRLAFRSSSQGSLFARNLA